MSDPALLQLCSAVVDLRNGAVLGAAGRTSLTGREAALLRYLVAREGQTVAQDELLAEVFGFRAGAQTRVLASTLRRLRAKLGEDPAHPQHLLTVYGEGVRFERGHRSLAPARADVLVGRSAELAVLLAARQPVVLVGCGGIGKSALARALLARQSGWWVDLSGTQQPDDAADAIAAAVGMLVRGPPGAFGARLAALGPGWLVLDGVEPLLYTLGELLTPWIAAAPAIRWVLTARQVPQLPFPHLTLPVQPLADDAAVTLLETRLQAVSAEDLPPADRARIVAMTDGIPLAIELAAARARLVGAAALADHLQAAGLRGLGRRDGERHASVVSAVQLTLDRLSAEERAALSRLCCFPADFSAEAAAVLLGPGGLSALEALRDASVLCAAVPGPRMRLYATVREAVAVLVPPDAAAQHAFLTWAAGFVGAQADRLRTPALGDALRALEAEWPALLAALAHFERDPALGVVLLLGMSEVLRLSSRGLPRAALLAALAAADLPAALDPPRRVALARIASSRGDARGGLALLADHRTLPLPLRLEALSTRIVLHGLLGNLVAQRAEAAEALALAETYGDPVLLGRLAYRAAVAQPDGTREAALLRALTLLEGTGDQGAFVSALAGWGKVLAHEACRPRAAARVLARAVALSASWPPTQLGIQVRLLHAEALLCDRAHTEAITACQAIAHDAARWGLPMQARTAGTLHGAALLDAGRPEEAAVILEGCLAGTLQDGWHAARGTAWRLALCTIILGELDRTTELLAHIVRVTRPLPELNHIPALGLLSGLAAAAGDLALAQAAMDQLEQRAAGRLPHSRAIVREPLDRARLRAGGDHALRVALQARLAALSDPEGLPEGSRLDSSYDLRTTHAAFSLLATPGRVLQRTLEAQRPILQALLAQYTISGP